MARAGRRLVIVAIAGASAAIATIAMFSLASPVALSHGPSAVPSPAPLSTAPAFSARLLLPDPASSSHLPVPVPAPGPSCPAVQAQTFDLSAVPSAPEYRTDAPDGPAFLGSDAPALDRALARINRSLGAALRPDYRLAQLARWVYEHLGPDRSMPPQSALDVLSRRLGLPEPLPHLLVIDAQNVPRLSEAVSERLAKVFDLGAYTHIGGVAERRAEAEAGPDSSVAVVIAISRRYLRLAPLPRSLPASGRVRLEGGLEGAYAAPELAHTLPSGETRITELGPGKGFRTTVRLAETGRHRLEILGQGPEGPEVLANVPIYVGVPVVDSIEAAAEPADAAISSPDAARDRLFELINAERVKSRLAPLAYDPELAAVALRHSQDMLANDFVAHVSPTEGGTAERLLKSGVVTGLAAENVGRGYTPDEVHRGFLDSPGHRAAILLPDVTHVGIGVVTKTEYGRTSFLVTEVFIRRIPLLGPDAKSVLLKELNRRRISTGATPVREDSAMSAVADETAREFLAEPSTEQKEIQARLLNRLRPLRRRGEASLYSIICSVGSLEEAAEQVASDPKAGRFDHVALGLAQGSPPGSPPNSIVAVFVFLTE